jgi:cellulose biosynthesis protein BcsQ
MSIIISLLNHKGGVGKTTSAINISAALVKLGKKVMLVDLDPQANLTVSLGIPRQKVTIYENMRGEAEIQPYVVKDGMHVVSSSLDLSGAEMELINEAGREYILRELFEPLKEEYDYIIIDCPPSLGLLTLNALTTSNYVVVPMQTEFLALQGLAKIKQINKTLPVVLITKNETENLMDDAIGSQISDYLIKPVNPNQVLLSIKGTIQRRPKIHLVSAITCSGYFLLLELLMKSVKT